MLRWIRDRGDKGYIRSGVVARLITAMLVVMAACTLEEDTGASDCTTAYDSAFDWQQEVKARADLPDTFERNRPWFRVRPGASLRAEHPRAEFMAFNFTIQNVLGARVTHHSVAAFSPPPACRLLEVWVFEGRLG